MARRKQGVARTLLPTSARPARPRARKREETAKLRKGLRGTVAGRPSTGSSGGAARRAARLAQRVQLVQQAHRGDCQERERASAPCTAGVCRALSRKRTSDSHRRSPPALSRACPPAIPAAAGRGWPRAEPADRTADGVQMSARAPLASGSIERAQTTQSTNAAARKWKDAMTLTLWATRLRAPGRLSLAAPEARCAISGAWGGRRARPAQIGASCLVSSHARCLETTPCAGKPSLRLTRRWSRPGRLAPPLFPAFRYDSALDSSPKVCLASYT